MADGHREKERKRDRQSAKQGKLDNSKFGSNIIWQDEIKKLSEET